MAQYIPQHIPSTAQQQLTELDGWQNVLASFKRSIGLRTFVMSCITEKLNACLRPFGPVRKRQGERSAERNAQAPEMGQGEPNRRSSN